MNIWQAKIARVSVYSDTVDIDILSVQDLRWENRGFMIFVRDVLRTTLIRGDVYDDSDPKAAFSGGPWVWYLPVSKVLVNSRAIL